MAWPSNEGVADSAQHPHVDDVPPIPLCSCSLAIEALRGTIAEAPGPIAPSQNGGQSTLVPIGVVAEQRQLADMALASVSTSSTILNSVLSLSAIESGRFQLRCVPTKLASVLEQVRFQMQPWATAAHAALDLELPRGGIDFVLADGPRLAQVLSNWISNSLKAVSQDGSGRVLVSLEVMGQRPENPHEPGQCYSFARCAGNVPESFTYDGQVAEVQIRVSDNGRGIPEDQQDKLFQPWAVGPPSPHTDRLSHGPTTSTSQLRRRQTLSRLSIPAKDSPASPVAASDRHAPMIMAASPGDARGRQPHGSSGSHNHGQRGPVRQPYGSSGSEGHQGAVISQEPSFGLGLSITKSIIEAFGGTVGVRSERGAGSVFYADFSVPLLQPAPARAQRAPYIVSSSAAESSGQLLSPSIFSTPPLTSETQSTRSEEATSRGGSSDRSRQTSARGVATTGTAVPEMLTHAESPEPASGRPLRILIAEDEPLNRKLLVRLLRNRWPSAVIHEAVDGAAAVECIQSATQAGHEHHPYDVLLLDGHMPRMTGNEAAREIRAAEADAAAAAGGALPRLRIVGVTGNALQEDQQAFIAAGARADEILTKPVLAASVYAAVERGL